MANLRIAGILVLHKVRIVDFIEHLLHIAECGSLFILVGCRTDAMIAVPVDVAFGSFRVDVLTVGKVETAVVVLGVVSAVCSGSSVVSCQFQIDIPLFLYFFVRSLMRSNHRSDTILLSNGSRISRPCLEIFSRNREVVLSEKDLCVCYTAKKVTYRSFPQWEIMAFVAFCLEEFAFALQEKYNRETWSRTGTENS